MKTYVKPSIVDCGKSEEVIKGKCGWGKKCLDLIKQVVIGRQEGCYINKDKYYGHVVKTPYVVRRIMNANILN